MEILIEYRCLLAEKLASLTVYNFQQSVDLIWELIKNDTLENKMDLRRIRFAILGLASQETDPDEKLALSNCAKILTGKI